MDRPVFESEVTHGSSPQKAQIIGGLIGGCFALCLVIFLLQLFWRKYIKGHRNLQDTDVQRFDDVDAQGKNPGRDLENTQTTQPREKQLDPFQTSQELNRHIKPLPEIPQRPQPLLKTKPVKGKANHHEVSRLSASKAPQGRYTAQNVVNPFA